MIFVSGFADAFDPTLGPFVAKPCDAGTLLREVRALLDRANERRTIAS
ncbi:MAG: hypothetical protein KF901_08835 [Myxococcales bacterium]|nr:hypothetical protein [Myxococcales bacterium]